MNFKTAFIALTAIVMVSTSSAASAGMYFLGGAGVTSHEFYNVSNSSGYKVGIGYLAPTNFGLEASYINFGSASITAPTGTLDMSGTNISGVMELPLYPLIMSLKVGLYNIDATSVTSTTQSASSTGISWGILLGYEMNKNVTLFMDTEGFGTVDVTNGNFETPALITFGARFKM